MLVSIAIPCYKSKNTIERVVDEIRHEFSKYDEYEYQIILVNDYPFDETFSVIEKLCNNDKNIIGVNLSRNFGQTSAKMAAIPYVTGDVLVFMDDDGQHPAEGIIPLANKVIDGYDVVYAHFEEKKHSLFKRITSNINSKLSEINGTKVKGIHTSSFYAISRFSVNAYKDYNSPFPAMAGYLNAIAGKTTELEMIHRERIEGSSNYTFRKLIKLWLNGFTNFSVVPLRFVSLIGIIIAVLGFLFGCFIVINKIITPSMAAGYTSTIAVILFLGGLILLALGFIGEYIGRIYMTISNLPQYKIRKVINNKEITNEKKKD